MEKQALKQKEASREASSGERLTSMRGALELLKERGQLLEAQAEVDPVYEVSGILKAVENGPAILFNNVKGFPWARISGGIFARKENLSCIFGLEDPRRLKYKCLEALRNPLPPRIVDRAPCQEKVIATNLDVPATLPILKYTEYDGAPVQGGGVVLAMGDYYRKGSDLSFKRMIFRGKDWSSLAVERTSHLGGIRYAEHRGENIPLTINIGAPPACMMVAATYFPRPVIPFGADELGFAGALQGEPVEIVKAKTVDTYALAKAEWVLEGYFLTERVWETEEAEKAQKQGLYPMFPEWTGYMGKAYLHRKFQVTAITHRADKPIAFTPLAHSFEGENMGFPFREAAFLELAERLSPSFVVDINILNCLKFAGGVIYQVKKRGMGDEGMQRNLLAAALSASPGQRLAIVVDEDVNIYNADDVLWAVMTRSEPNHSIVRGPRGSIGQALMPSERHGERGWGGFEGGVGIDATIPFVHKSSFQRAKYPVYKVDLKKWFPEEEISKVKANQSEYARFLAESGG